MYVCSNSLDKDYDMYVTVFIYSDVGCYGEGGNVDQAAFRLLGRLASLTN